MFAVCKEAISEYCGVEEETVEEAEEEGEEGDAEGDAYEVVVTESWIS